MKSKVKIIVISVLLIASAIITVNFAFFRIKATRQVKFDRETDETTDVIIIDDEDLKPVYEYTPKEVFSISWGKIIEAKEFEVTTTGKSEATVPLLGTTEVKIKNHRIVKNGEAFIECISAGILSSGSQRFLSDDKVVLRNVANGDVDKDNLTANFDNATPEIINKNEYLTRYGWLPYQINGYIFNDNTYLEDPTITANREDNTYTLSIKLNPESDAAVYYLREVATNASAKEEPVFTKIEFEVVIDSNFYVQKVTTHEEYNIVPGLFPINTPTSTKCVDTYNYNNVSFDETLYNYYKEKLSA
jgi:hypothetical protein